MTLQHAARNTLERILAGGATEQVSNIPNPEQFTPQPVEGSAPTETPEQQWERLRNTAYGGSPPTRDLRADGEQPPIEIPPPPPPSPYATFKEPPKPMTGQDVVQRQLAAAKGFGHVGEAVSNLIFGDTYDSLEPWQAGVLEFVIQGGFELAMLSGLPTATAGRLALEAQIAKEPAAVYKALEIAVKKGLLPAAKLEEASAFLFRKAGQGISKLGKSEPVVSEAGGIKLPKSTPEVTGGVAEKHIPPTAMRYTSKVARRVAQKIDANPEPIDEVLMAKVKGSFEVAVKTQKETAKLYKTQRYSKAAQMGEAFSEQEGVKSYLRAKGALRGVLEKGEFDIPTEFKLTKADTDVVLNRLYNLSHTLSSYETFDISTAIMKLGGLLRDKTTGLPQRLTKSDLELLQVGFPELRPIAEAYKTLGQKAWSTLSDILNLPRSLLASGDLSFTFRQGAMALARKPQHIPGTIRTQLQVLFSPKNYENIDKALLEDAGIQSFIKNGLYWAPEPGKVGGRLWAREEQFMSNLAERLPVIGKFVKASERAFQGGANYLRGQVAKDYTKMLEKMGALTDENMADLAKVINSATGRGDLPKALNNAAPIINALFFSPRYTLSRLQLPGLMFSKNPIVRKEAVRTLTTFMGAGSSVIGMAGMAGAKIEMNPLSSDFGKLKVGNTRLDIWTGYAQWSRMLAQLITNQRKTTTTGKIQEINRYETLLRFMQSKQSPMAGLMTDLLVGKTYIGEPMFEGGWETLGREAKNRLVALFFQDMIDALNQDGFPGGLAAIPGGLGVGVVTYESGSKSPTKPSKIKLSPAAKEVIKKARQR